MSRFVLIIVFGSVFGCANYDDKNNSYVSKEIRSFVVKIQDVKPSVVAVGKVTENNNSFELNVLLDLPDYNKELKGSIESVYVSFQDKKMPPWKVDVIRIEKPNNNFKTKTIYVVTNLGGKENLVSSGIELDVELIPKLKKDIPAIPYKAIITLNNAEHVARLDGERVNVVPVKIGKEDFQFIQIVNGIKEGDVLVFPYENMKNGDVVRNVKLIEPY